MLIKTTFFLFSSENTEEEALSVIDLNCWTGGSHLPSIAHILDGSDLADKNEF